MKNYRFRLLSSLALMLGFVLASGAPVAAKECKETTSKTSCERSTSCTWVKGYTISKGKQKGKKVSAYCRKKGGKKSAASKKDGSGNAAKQSKDKSADMVVTGKARKVRKKKAGTRDKAVIDRKKGKADTG